MTFGDRLYVVHVLNRRALQFRAALKSKLNSLMGLHLEQNSGVFEITGHCYRFRDWLSLANIATESHQSFRFQASLDEDVKGAAIEYFRKKTREMNLPAPQFYWSPSPRVALGEDSVESRSFWINFFQPFGVDVEFDKAQLSIKPLVRVKILVAEVNKSLAQNIGIQWPDAVAAQLTPHITGPSELEVLVKAMESRGLAQILASPNLLARSGSEADFLAGGEIPIKIVSKNSRDVVWKRHGIYLKIKPQADSAGRLSIELTTEVSLLDSAQTVDGIPAMKTNRMSTHFDLVEPRTIVLSGLIRNDWGDSFEGLPWLSRLPILGGLFRSEDFHHSRSELVIFVSPEIVKDSDAKLTPQMPKGYIDHGDLE